MAKHYYLGESAARKLAALFRGSTGVRSVAGPTAAPVDEEEYPAPFHIQWSDSEGGWIIWIPAGSITSDHGYEAELLDTLTAATEYGDGWYLLDLDIGSSWTAIYLDCWGDKESSSETAPTVYHAELVTTLETHQRLVERYVVRIADAKRNSTTGATDVKQITVGALVLKGGSGGGSPQPAEKEPQPFDLDGNKVVRCQVYLPDVLVTCADAVVNVAQPIYLHVNKITSSPGYSIAVDNQSRAVSDSHAQYTLYTVVNGAITCVSRPISIGVLRNHQ